MQPRFNISISNLTQWMVVGGIFCERWFELAVLIVVNILIFSETRQLRLSRGILVMFGVIAVYTITSTTLLGYSYGKFIQQFCMTFIFVMCYYNIFEYHKDRLYPFFDRYITMCYLVALLGLLQFAIFFVTGINIMGFLYEGREAGATLTANIIRISSVLDEPSFLSTMITPAVIYLLLGGEVAERRKLKMAVIFTGLMLTFSTISYIIIALFFVYWAIIYTRKPTVKAVSFILLALILFFGSGRSVEESASNEKGLFFAMSEKISDTYGAFDEMEPHAFELLNLSSYAVMTNLWVSINAPNRISGTGFGTHEQSYKSLYQSDFSYYGLNKVDGASLFTRIFSEFGLLGILVIFWFLYKNYNKQQIINVAMFFVLLTLLIRGGHYFRYGVIFFFFFFYYSNKLLNIRGGSIDNHSKL